MQSAPIRSFEYKNAFLYIVIREEPRLGPDSYIYCCGINLSLFCRLSWRKGGICSNPAVRGIQLLRTHVSAFAAKQGMIVKKEKGIDSTLITPHGHGWYHQDPLRLEQATPERIRKLLEFSVSGSGGGLSWLSAYLTLRFRQHFPIRLRCRNTLSRCLWQRNVTG